MNKPKKMLPYTCSNQNSRILYLPKRLPRLKRKQQKRKKERMKLDSLPKKLPLINFPATTRKKL